MASLKLRWSRSGIGMAVCAAVALSLVSGCNATDSVAQDPAATASSPPASSEPSPSGPAVPGSPIVIEGTAFTNPAKLSPTPIPATKDNAAGVRAMLAALPAGGTDLPRPSSSEPTPDAEPSATAEAGKGIPYQLCDERIYNSAYKRYYYPDYYGRCSAYAVVNQDLSDRSKWGVTCGTAAVATVLTNTSSLYSNRRSGIKKFNPATINTVYQAAPPDTPGQLFGTSPARVFAALKLYGRNPQVRSGEETLKAYLRAGNMPILLVDVGAVPQEGWKGTWGLHYVTAFGYNNNGVYVSNWPGDGFISWANLRTAWDTWLTRAILLNNFFIVPSK